MDELQARLKQTQDQIAAEKGKGAARDMNFIAELEQTEAEILKRMDEAKQAEQNEQIVSTQSSYSGGLKEQIYNLIEMAFPKDLMAKLIGLTEYEEIAQEYRQNVDATIDENTGVLFATIGQQIELKDGKIREITAQNIELAAENDKLKKALESDEETIVQLQTQLSSADRQLDQMTDLVKENASLKEQNAKLEELAKAPQQQIVLPGATQPSQALQNQRQQSASKVRSALEIALEGRQFRGPVTIMPPKLQEPTMPSSFGGSESADSFRGEDPASDAQDDTVSSPTPPTNVGDSFPTEVQDDGNTLGGQPSNGELAPKTIEERVADLEERMNRMENQSGVAA